MYVYHANKSISGGIKTLIKASKHFDTFVYRTLLYDKVTATTIGSLPSFLTTD